MRPSIVLAVAVLAVARPALADDPVPRAAIEGDMLSYYGGEQTSAYLILGLSIAYVGAGLPLTIQSGDFGRGMGVPLLSLGILEGLGAVFYASQVAAEIRHYRGQLSSDPDGFRKDELTHIEGTQARFAYYQTIEMLLTVGGIALATYGFFTQHDLLKGVGVGLLAVGLPLFIIDSVNDARASRYHSRLRRFAPTLSLQKDAQGWRIALATRF